MFGMSLANTVATLAASAAACSTWGLCVRACTRVCVRVCIHPDLSFYSDDFNRTGLILFLYCLIAGQ